MHTLLMIENLEKFKIIKKIESNINKAKNIIMLKCKNAQSKNASIIFFSLSCNFNDKLLEKCKVTYFNIKLNYLKFIL
jgi:hypothetical protein